MGLLIPYSPYKIQCKNCSKANLCLGTDHPESSLYLCSSCLTHFRAFAVSLCPSALRERDKPGSHCWGLPVPSSLLAGTSPQLLVPQHSFPLTPLRRPGRQDQKAQRPASRAQSERRSVVRPARRGDRCAPERTACKWQWASPRGQGVKDSGCPAVAPAGLPGCRHGRIFQPRLFGFRGYHRDPP